MWMQRGLEKVFALKTKVIGKRLGTLKELVVLGRTVWFEDQGITYKADPKHAEQLIADVNMTHAKPSAKPGNNNKKTAEEVLEGEVKLDGKQATNYRAAVARFNYLFSDRPDLQFSTKEIARSGRLGKAEGHYEVLGWCADYYTVVQMARSPSWSSGVKR